MRDPALSDHPTIIDHSRSDHIDGLISVAGVKYTTARNVAEKTINIAFKKLGREPSPSISAVTRLPGGDIEDYSGLVAQAELKNIPEQLIKDFGTKYTAIIDNSDDEDNTLDAELECRTAA